MLITLHGEQLGAGWEAGCGAASPGWGRGGQARGPLKAQASSAWRNGLTFFNFIPAVKSIPNNNI